MCYPAEQVSNYLELAPTVLHLNLCHDGRVPCSLQLIVAAIFDFRRNCAWHKLNLTNGGLQFACWLDVLSPAMRLEWEPRGVNYRQMVSHELHEGLVHGESKEMS